MARQKTANSPFLYDNVTGDLVGFKDPDGSERYWVMHPYQPFEAKDVPELSVVAPASTFTAVSVYDDSGTAVLASTGVHGLTDAVSQGKYIYIAWAGGTAVSGFYEVLDADSANDEIKIDLAYAAGLGTPTVSLVNTDITLASVVIPAYTINVGMGLQLDILVGCTASTNNKTVKANLGSGAWYSQTFAGNNASACVEKKACALQGDTILSNALAAPGHGLSTGAIVSFSPSGGFASDQTFAILGSLSTANEVMTLEAWQLRINGT